MTDTCTVPLYRAIAPALAPYFEAAEPLKHIEAPLVFSNRLAKAFTPGFPVRERMCRWLADGVSVERMPVSLYGKVKP